MQSILKCGNMNVIFLIKKECEFIKMDNKKKLLFMKKNDLLQKTKIIEVNDIYKVSSFQILYYW